MYSYPKIILRHYNTLSEIRKNQKGGGLHSNPSTFQCVAVTLGITTWYFFPQRTEKHVLFPNFRHLLQKKQILLVVKEKEFMFPGKYYNNKSSRNFSFPPI